MTEPRLDDDILEQLVTITVQQERAIDLVLLGKTDAEVAKEIGVARGTVNRWRNLHPGFKAALNQRRWEAMLCARERFRPLIEKAVGVLCEVLEGPSSKERTRVAMEIVNGANLPKSMTPGSTDPVEIMRNGAVHQQFDKGWDLDDEIMELGEKLLRELDPNGRG